MRLPATRSRARRRARRDPPETEWLIDKLTGGRALGRPRCIAALVRLRGVWPRDCCERPAHGFRG